MHVPELHVLSVKDDGLGAAVRAIRTGWTLKKPEEKKNGTEKKCEEKYQARHFVI